VCKCVRVCVFCVCVFVCVYVCVWYTTQVSVAGNTLRILTIQRLGEVFNQQVFKLGSFTHPLKHIYRNIIVHAHTHTREEYSSMNVYALIAHTDIYACTCTHE